VVSQIETCKQSLRKPKAPSQETNPYPLTWMVDRLGTYPVGCHINASWMTNQKFYWNRVMRDRMV